MTMMKKEGATGPLINEKIRFDKLQLITHLGENRGIVSRFEALSAAREAGLDLVIINQQGAEGVPVAKILDFGKLQYEKKKQAAKAKEKQQIIQVKEVQLRPKIAEHDRQTKTNMAIRFLQEGKHVKVVLQFRGREVEMRAITGELLFKKIEEAFEAADFGGRTVVKKDDTAVPGASMWARIYSLKNK